MSINGIRFRVHEGLCVLQVSETTVEDDYYSNRGRTKTVWRDAAPEDLLQVAAYTRAHDTLTSELQGLRAEVEGVPEGYQRARKPREQRQQPELHQRAC